MRPNVVGGLITDGAACQVRACTRTVLAQVALPVDERRWEEVEEQVWSCSRLTQSAAPLLATSPEIVVRAFRMAFERAVTVALPDLASRVFVNLYLRNQYGAWQDRE